ncbi:MAG TPA: cupin domain-containing protein [Planctomycetota bacterium]|nr:cupin domain-containing protein [Planctomycetota bacterium]
MTKDCGKKCCPANDELLPKAKAVTLARLVAYAPGAVVSRTLAKSGAGTVTLFAFDAGQELSEHSAPFDALVHVLDGEAELIIGGKPVRAREGELVVMPADVPHAVKAPGRFKMLLIMLRTARD